MAQDPYNFPAVFNSLGELPESKKPGETMSYGVGGVKIGAGYVLDDYLPELHGERGRRIYREMKDGDSTAGALLAAIEMILRSVDFKVEAAEGDLDRYYADFMEEQMTGMDYTWDEVLAEILTFLAYGFSVMEMVFRYREDGLIETAKLAPRAQETVWEWDIDEHGDIRGCYQWPPYGGQRVYIPADNMLLFRTKLEKGNPEGKSILRNGYKNYHYIKNIMMLEAIGIERDLAGLPCVKVPAAVFETENSAILARYEAIARDIKKNSQGGIVIPSTPYQDNEGKPTNMPQYEVSLLASSGNKSIDTNKVILRHQMDMMRTVLADFIMLGSGDKGSFALSKDKSSLFLKSITGYVSIICSTLDKWIDTLWELNSFPDDMKPKITHGRIESINLEELGGFMRNIGMMVQDKETENFIREITGLPKLEEGDAI